VANLYLEKPMASAIGSMSDFFKPEFEEDP
jgi:hypothetical protein